jgi:hypothetical protein
MVPEINAGFCGLTAVAGINFLEILKNILAPPLSYVNTGSGAGYQTQLIGGRPEKEQAFEF